MKARRFFYRNGKLNVWFTLGKFYFFLDYDAELSCKVRTIKLNLTNATTRALKFGPFVFSVVTIHIKKP